MSHMEGDLSFDGYLAYLQEEAPLEVVDQVCSDIREFLFSPRGRAVQFHSPDQFSRWLDTLNSLDMMVMVA